MSQYIGRSRGSFRASAIALAALVCSLLALPATAQNGPQPNLFELRSGNDIRVTYRASNTAAERRVRVQAPGIDLDLSGDDIAVSENSVNTLVSVPVQIDQRGQVSVTATLVVPRFNLGTAREATFSTIGVVTTQQLGSGAQGALSTYRSVTLTGTARLTN
jgi:hypothetical protein